MKKVAMILVTMVMVTVLLAPLALAETDTLKTADTPAKTWRFTTPTGYLQFSADRLPGTFSLPLKKIIARGSHGPQINICIEAQPTTKDPLLKAFLDYKWRPWLIVRGGQFSNPTKWVEPGPEDRITPFFALVESYAPTFDDIGLALYGTWHRITYYTCFFNGTGRNVLDNNLSKDFVEYVKLDMASLAVELCWQYGQQPDTLRQRGFVRAILQPTRQLNLQAAYATRRDRESSGWYGTAIYGDSTVHVIGRIQRVTFAESAAYVVGLEGYANAKIKWQIATIIGKQRHSNTAILVQASF